MPLVISEAKRSKIEEMLADGVSIRDTARQLSVNPSTVERYKVLVTSEASSLPSVEHVKKDLVTYLYDLIGRMYGGITPDKVDKASMYQLTGSMGLLIDKVRLIQGLSTENVSVYSQASGMLRGVLEGHAEVRKVEKVEKAGAGVPPPPGQTTALPPDSPQHHPPDTKGIPKPLQDNELGDSLGSEVVKGIKQGLEEVKNPEDSPDYYSAAATAMRVVSDDELKSNAKKVILAELKKHKLDPVVKEEFKNLLDYL